MRASAAAHSRLALLCERVLEAGWLAAVFCVPLFFNVFSSRVFEPDKTVIFRALVAVMALAWVVRYVEEGDRPSAAQAIPFRWRGILECPLHMAALAFAAATLLSSFFSIASHTSFWGSHLRLQGAYTTVSYVAFFLMLADQLRTRQQLARLLDAAVLSGALVSLYGVAQHFGLDPLPWGGDVTFRVASTLGNAIFVAAYLIVLVPLTVAGLLLARTGLQRGLYGGALVVQILAVLFSQSRGPWLGLLAGLGLFALLIGLAWDVRRLWQGTLGAAVVLVILLAAINLPLGELEPLRQTPYIGRLGQLLETGGGTGRVRLLIWQGTLALVRSDPARLVVGYGPETMFVAFPRFYPPELAALENPGSTADRSHNETLDALVSGGVLGFAAMWALFALALWAPLRALGLVKGERVLWVALALGPPALLALLAGLIPTSAVPLVALVIPATLLGLVPWEGTRRRVRAVVDAAQRERAVVLAGLAAAVLAHLVEIQFGIAIVSTRMLFWLVLALVAALAARRLETEAAPVPAIVQRRSKAAPAAVRTTAHIWPAAWMLAAALALVTFAVLAAAAQAQDSNVFGQALTTLFVPLVLGAFAVAALAESWHRLAAAPWRLTQRVPRARYVAYAVLGLIAALGVYNTNLRVIAADVAHRQGESAETRRDLSAAIISYADAVELAPSDDTYFTSLARALLARGLAAPAETRDNYFRDGVALVEQARRLSPLHADHPANLGKAYRIWAEATTDTAQRQARLTRSLDYLLQALALSPGQPQLYNELGQTQLGLNDKEGAIASYETSRGLDPRAEESGLLLGEALELAGKPEQAEAAYRDAVRVAPDSLTAHLGLGRFLLDAARLPEAEGEYRRAVTLDPQSPAAHSGLSVALHKQGNLNQAIEESLTVAQLVPNEPTPLSNLARLYREAGQPAQALAYAEGALHIAPDDPTLQSLVADLKSQASAGK